MSVSLLHYAPVTPAEAQRRWSRAVERLWTMEELDRARIHEHPSNCRDNVFDVLDLTQQLPGFRVVVFRLLLDGFQVLRVSVSEHLPDGMAIMIADEDDLVLRQATHAFHRASGFTGDFKGVYRVMDGGRLAYMIIPMGTIDPDDHRTFVLGGNGWNVFEAKIEAEASNIM